MQNDDGVAQAAPQAAGVDAGHDWETLRANCAASVRRIGQVVGLLHRWRALADPLWHDAAQQLEDALRV